MSSSFIVLLEVWPGSGPVKEGVRLAKPRGSFGLLYVSLFSLFAEGVDNVDGVSDKGSTFLMDRSGAGGGLFLGMTASTGSDLTGDESDVLEERESRWRARATLVPACGVEEEVPEDLPGDLPSSASSSTERREPGVCGAFLGAYFT